MIKDTRSASASVDLPLDDTSPRVARRTAHDVLQRWQVQDEQLVFDAMLVATEMVANPARHGGDLVKRDLGYLPHQVTVAVSDGSSVLPEPRQAGDVDESARGLTFVEAVAAAWDIQTTSGVGKRVWATIELGAGEC